MTLGDLTLPISYEAARQYALVFDVALAQRLAEIHAKHGSNKCRPVPSVMRDGRLMLCADLLTEVGPGGLLEGMWAAADKTVLAQAVTVMPWADAVALLTPDPLMEGTPPNQPIAPAPPPSPKRPPGPLDTRAWPQR